MSWELPDKAVTLLVANRDTDRLHLRLLILHGYLDQQLVVAFCGEMD